jgi:hypothetical protein
VQNKQTNKNYYAHQNLPSRPIRRLCNEKLSS